MRYKNELKLTSKNDYLSLQIYDIQVVEYPTKKLIINILIPENEKSFEVDNIEHIKLALSVISGKISALQGIEHLKELELSPGQEENSLKKFSLYLLLANIVGSGYGFKAQRLIDNNLEENLNNSLLSEPSKIFCI